MKVWTNLQINIAQKVSTSFNDDAFVSGGGGEEEEEEEGRGGGYKDPAVSIN